MLKILSVALLSVLSLPVLASDISVKTLVTCGARSARGDELQVGIVKTRTAEERMLIVFNSKLLYDVAAELSVRPMYGYVSEMFLVPLGDLKVPASAILKLTSGEVEGGMRIGELSFPTYGTPLPRRALGIPRELLCRTQGLIRFRE